MDGLPFAIGGLVGGGIVWLWARRGLRDRDHWREKAEWLAKWLTKQHQYNVPKEYIPPDIGLASQNTVECWLRAADAATRKVMQ